LNMSAHGKGESMRLSSFPVCIAGSSLAVLL
jgi:hypothetical protein